MKELTTPLTFGQILKRYSQFREAYCKVCLQSLKNETFSPNEMNILVFLTNNPQINTQKELTVMLSVSKALICRSSESLEKKGYIQVVPDENDRRKVHLLVTKQAEPFIMKLQENMELFSRQVMDKIDPDEMRIYTKVFLQIQDEIDQMIEKGNLVNEKE